MRRLYTALLYLALPWVLLRLYWRGQREPAHRQRCQERFGYVPRLPAGSLWIHAVSLGEVRAAIPLVRALLKREAAPSLLLTTTTLTGSRQVQELQKECGAQLHHVYAPYDLPSAVQRFLARTNPQIAILMETELWPNLLRHCAMAGIPVLLANARLSARSARGYARVGGLTRTMLQDVALIAAQTAADAQRFVALGAPQVQVVGNLKYDLTVADTVREQGRLLRHQQLGAMRPVWIAASTHLGEDEQVLAAFSKLRERWADLLLVLVPRHPERFAAVAALCQRRGFVVTQRSARQACTADTAVFLGDSMGELLCLYAAADLAFVGGSLVPTGGHNVLEPALLGLPVLFGAHMFNFTEVSERLLDAQAAVQVGNAAELAAAVDQLLSNPQLRQELGERGRLLVAQHRGALARLLVIVEMLCGAAAVNTVSPRRADGT